VTISGFISMIPPVRAMNTGMLQSFSFLGKNHLRSLRSFAFSLFFDRHGRSAFTRHQNQTRIDAKHRKERKWGGMVENFRVAPELNSLYHKPRNNLDGLHP
jgi:hypothetical protein